ncbi:hypothetical protein [Rhodopirellula bahusiensis]|uniref:hypothetical protein n=1 Tax=Rhodopirellula bahusiensis TaxID=2014065 RepID=UPI0018EE17BD|nr:hypothetical protein [Rhodopirellula bahusiensis]
MDAFLLAFSFVDYFWDCWWEFKLYFLHLTKFQWMLLSIASVLSGFLCLRGDRFKI